MGYTLFPGAVLFRPEYYEVMAAELKVQQQIDMADYGYVDRSWCFFLPFDCWLNEKTTQEYVKHLGRTQNVPLLHYWNTEDDIGFEVEDSNKIYKPKNESWGYEVFSDGRSIARSDLRCDWPDWDERLAKKIRQSYPKAKTAAFELFDVTVSDIEKLDSLLEPQALLLTLEEQDMLEVAGNFQRILGIDDVFRN